MVSSEVISVLAFLHIVSAVAWLGGALLFVSSIAPNLRKMSPGAILEFAAKVGPKTARFFGIAATLTIVFGLALLFAAFGTDFAAWPSSIEIGFGLGLVAYLIAIMFTIPTSRRIDKIAHEIMNNPTSGPPPPEFGQNLKKLGTYTLMVTILLILTAIFMVVTAFPF